MKKQVFAKQKLKKIVNPRADGGFRDLSAAVLHLDELIKLIYLSDEQSREFLQLRRLWINRVEVCFCESIESVTLEKAFGTQTLSILAPAVAKNREASRREELLLEYGDLLIKFQRQAVMQVREMLIQILDTKTLESFFRVRNPKTTR